MGRRSRKREGATTRAERDAARAERVAASGTGAPSRRRRPGRPDPDERPRPPWGNFPLSEILIFAGIVLIVWGAFSGDEGRNRIAAGLVLASLGGGELALREHLAGFRSHSTLLASVVAFAVVTAVALGLGPVKVWALGIVGVAVFAASFYGLRELFKRRSGGLGFR